MTDQLIDRFKEQLARQGFRLGQRLGRGAFGTVYQAQQDSLGRPVAVKLFNASGPAVAPDEVGRFRKEARLLAKVEHPSLPYVVTTGEVKVADQQDTVPYLVMQYINGENLDQMLKRERQLSVEKATELTVQLLDVLHALHRRGILHRDIKPNNILISEGRAILIDFSLGVSLKYEEGLTRGTKERQGFGVADYAAPEQLDNAKDCDHRVDLYSLGKVLFEMLVGHPKLDIKPIESQLEGGREVLAAVIAKACKRNREERFEDAAAFRNAMVPFMEVRASLADTGPGICTNARCGEANWSPKGYYFSPHFEEEAPPFCSGCGQKFLRGCEHCGNRLSAEHKRRLSRTTKSEGDVADLYCSACGHLIFKAPICENCGSMLKKKDMDRDTSQDGCGKCEHSLKTDPFGLPEDDDIPF